MSVRPDLFKPMSFFRSGANPDYELLPFRFGRVPGLPDEILVSSETGEYHFLSEDDFKSLVQKRLSPLSTTYLDLRSKKFLADASLTRDLSIRLSAARLRSRKSFLRGGNHLHILVVTLRCDHSCPYCQVSRQTADKMRFDMSDVNLRFAVDRIFEASSDAVTVEFQGGEPLLAFETIRKAVELIEDRNVTGKKHLSFVVATTLHLADDSILQYFRKHNIRASTSLDGPPWLHNANRPNRDGDSHSRTIQGIDRARAAIGDENVAALVTITKASLDHARAIVDEYVDRGFRSIFLRPLSPFGFASKASNRLGYSPADFLAFYQQALEYIIDLNCKGTCIEEAYATLLLTHILTPFSTRYVDLRSPCGAGLDTLVYNYDGLVYPSDEARMLAEMGNSELSLGHVSQPLSQLLQSQAMEQLLAGGIAEALPGCSDCVYLPYCGADPVFSIATQGDPIGHRPTSSFCRRQTGMFELLFRSLRKKNPETIKVFLSWLSRKAPSEILAAGYAP